MEPEKYEGVQEDYAFFYRSPSKANTIWMNVVDNKDLFMIYCEDDYECSAAFNKEINYWSLCYRDQARLYGDDFFVKEEDNHGKILDKVLRQLYFYYLKVIYVSTLINAREIEIFKDIIFEDEEERRDYNSRSQDSIIYQKLFAANDEELWKVNTKMLSADPFAETIKIPYHYKV